MTKHDSIECPLLISIVLIPSSTALSPFGIVTRIFDNDFVWDFNNAPSDTTLPKVLQFKIQPLCLNELLETLPIKFTLGISCFSSPSRAISFSYWFCDIFARFTKDVCCTSSLLWCYVLASLSLFYFAYIRWILDDLKTTILCVSNFLTMLTPGPLILFSSFVTIRVHFECKSLY